MIRLAVLGSTRGSNLAALVEAIWHKHLNARIEIVIANKADALILTRAQEFALPHLFVSPTGKSREAYDAEISTLLKQYQIDLIVLIGYMRILSNTFVSEWKHKMINVHPSLLPDFAGLMDLAVHEAVIQARKTETGCTVHYVTEQVDAGPILLQRRCEVFATDTAETLKKRVQALEGRALVDAIQAILINPPLH